MIAANELRIGNEIEDGTVDAIHPHEQMPKIEVIKNGVRKFIYLNLANPIPLTEEWLVKFGFENISKSWNFCYTKGDRKFVIKEETDITMWVGISLSDRNAHIANCKYVHQLQNLIHALTGEELTIKKTASCQ